MTPIEVQRRRSKGWKIPPNTLSVTRPGPWGNPFVVGEFGTREECVKAHKILLMGFIYVGPNPSMKEQKKYYNFVKENIHKLKGKNLACFCKIGDPCHRQILLKIANQ